MVLDLLQFVFKDIWHFFGTVFLIFILGGVISDIIKAGCPDYRPTIYTCSKCLKDKEDSNAHTDTTQSDS